MRKLLAIGVVPGVIALALLTMLVAGAVMASFGSRGDTTRVHLDRVGDRAVVTGFPAEDWARIDYRDGKVVVRKVRP